jgi:uncharacterized protein
VSTVASPCVSICVMNDATGLCRGCCRTLDEIARWSVMHDSEKKAVLVLVEARKGATGGSDPCG